MSASMAAVLAEHYDCGYDPAKGQWECRCGHPLKVEGFEQNHTAHQEAMLAANGYGKLEPTRFVLAEREAELLNLKGPCRAPQCRLHHAHRGPCDTRRSE